MLRPVASLIVCATAVAPFASVLGAPPAAAARHAAAGQKCGFHGLEQEHVGPSYVTSLSVQGVGCAAAKRLVKAYYSCRVHAGGVRGHCRRSVLGFHCSEQRSGIASQFDAKVTCASGRRTVTHTYVQNT
jgi:hypothetical protein